MVVTTRRVYSALIVAIALILPLTSLAIDNPDAPNFVEEFQDRIQPYEDRIHDQTQRTQDYQQAYQEYERFLDGELNDAYRSVIAKLDKAQAERLKQSQRHWLKFRDAEFDFIESNWTPDAFGSSSVVSRGAYRTQLIKDRIIALLRYLKNYQ